MAESIKLAESFLREYCHEDIGRMADGFPHDQRTLWVDYKDLTRFDATTPGAGLAEDLETDPRQAVEWLETALERYDLPINISLDGAKVKVHNIPTAREYSPVETYSVPEPPALVAVRGHVAKVADPAPEAVTIVWECLRCGTETEIPQTTEEVQEPGECSGCQRNGPFRENTAESQQRSHQLARVAQPPEETSGGDGAHIDVHLRDDLVGSVEPGDRVVITGVYDLGSVDEETGEYGEYMDAHNVRHLESKFEDIDPDDHLDRIRALARGEEGDPFDLLTDTVAPSIAGEEYEDIKLSLALQLFGGVRVEKAMGEADRGDSHILLIGDPGKAKSKLLSYMRNLSPRAVGAEGKGATQAGLTAAAVQDDFGGSSWSVEAGAMVAADGGIVTLDEIDKVPEDVRGSLNGAMANQIVQVNKAGINSEMNARTAVLAAGNPEYGRFDKYEPVPEQIDLGPTLLSRFDLIFHLVDEVDEDKDRELAEAVVDSHTESVRVNDPEDEFSEDDAEYDPAVERDVLRAWVAHAKREYEPVIRDESVRESLIKSFTEMRKLGAGDDSPIPMTARKLEAFFRLAEASARVRLSREIGEEDIDRARRLVKRSMDAILKDPESGEYDADIVETSTDFSQHQRLKEIVIPTLKDMTDEGRDVVDREAVEERLAEEGMSERHIIKDLEGLKEKGEIYNPESDTIAWS